MCTYRRQHVVIDHQARGVIISNYRLVITVFLTFARIPLFVQIFYSHAYFHILVGDIEDHGVIYHQIQYSSSITQDASSSLH